jgi:DNA-binding PadR family transcriptional regulator
MSGISTKHVVLGLLVERPGYGYELAQRLESRLGFLGLQPNSIYRILDRLEDDGWIVEVGKRTVGRTRRGAARVMYGPTPTGVAQLKDWIARPSDRAVLRDELHAKLVVADPADLPGLLATVERQARECLSDLASLRRPVLADARRPDAPWPHVAAMLVDDFAARWLQCLADWLDNVSVVIEDRIESAANSPGPWRG